jgi:hypothetical protein
VSACSLNGGLGRGDVIVSDVVIQFPVQSGEEAQLFGAYLAEFMEGLSDEAERWAAHSDAPFLMVRSDPIQDAEVKVLTFQHPSAAQAFCSGWARARRKAAAAG